MDNRYYMIFNVFEIHKVDFNQVLQNSTDDLRLSVDGSKTLVKWDGPQIPPFFDDFTTKEGPYTYEQMFALINTSTWKPPLEGV